MAELYAYFRFLGVHWADDFDEFRKKFGDIEKVLTILVLDLHTTILFFHITKIPNSDLKDDVQERLNAIVPSIMLRR